MLEAKIYTINDLKVRKHGTFVVLQEGSRDLKNLV